MSWRFLVLIILLILSPNAFAQKWLTCKVIKVVDGDTIHCLNNRISHRIRLDGIDAPERKQAFGKKAQQALSQKITHQTVLIQIYKKDRYGRSIGRLYHHRTDMNAWMVEQGYAWAYRQYLSKRNKHYLAIEQKARQRKRGLWIEGNRAIYPPKYRKNLKP